MNASLVQRDFADAVEHHDGSRSFLSAPVSGHWGSGTDDRGNWTKSTHIVGLVHPVVPLRRRSKQLKDRFDYRLPDHLPLFIARSEEFIGTLGGH